MPLKMGHSHEVVADNVRELIRAGHKPKQAVAVALAHARKTKMMAAGGVVESDDADVESPIPAYGLGEDEQGLSESVEDAGEMARAIQAAKYAANDNSVSYKADDKLKGMSMHEKEDEQPEMSGKDPVGLKPEIYGNGGKEDLSAEAMAAIMEKKKKRRFF